MKIGVEVVYALADAQTVIHLELERGARVADALAAASRVADLPEKAACDVGIWGKIVALDTELQDRDRVEIYRDLVADPKQARRQRARQQRGPTRR